MKKILAISLLLCTVLYSQCQLDTKNKKEEKTTREEPAKDENKPKRQKKEVDVNTPVATYSANMEDEVTNNDFEVKIFPTEDPRAFKLTIRFGENRAQDKVEFPKPEYYEQVALRKGKDSNACLIGFIGKDGAFNKMKEVVGTTTQISINHLKSYYFKTKIK